MSNLRHNPKSACLSFTAEDSAGLTSNPTKGAPDREALQVLTFTGAVHEHSISGKIGARDFYCSKCRPVFQRVKLKRIEGSGRTGELQAFPE